MKLCLVILALLAFASPTAAQPPEPEGEVYSGFGTEPFWDVTFEDGKIILHQDEERIEVPRPRPTTTRAGVHIPDAALHRNCATRAAARDWRAK